MAANEVIGPGGFFAIRYPKTKLATLLPAYKKMIMYTAISVIAFVSILILIVTIMGVIDAIINNDLISSTKHTVLNIIGNFLLLVVCVELLDTLYAYAIKQKIHVEIVILVTLTAVSRELIVFDYNTVSSLVLVGIGVAIIALSSSYYLIRKSRTNRDRHISHEE
ncbi:MAG: phosphate-starvation-inducible PsiE family protein [Methanomassiliicoccus sp.]|nr:phosphate-starvation-inducible PsiE family protein [Methanomassiliicoccus sp.]